MDGFEFNKIAGAVLGTALVVMGLGIIAEFIYEPIEAEEPAYVIAVATQGEEGETGDGEASDVEPIAVRLQVADAGAGEAQAKKCLACHTFGQGGPAKVGPNLWGVVGRTMAGMEGFGYSSAMQEAGSGNDEWTFERLDEFLSGPKAAIPGTSMAFAGLKRPEQRADVIAYLRTLSESPVSLPAVAEAPEADESDMEPDAGTDDAAAEEPPADDGTSGEEPAAEMPAEAPADEEGAAEESAAQ